MERVLTGDLGHVLVDDDTSGLERLRRQLLVLARAQVHAEREVLDRGGLSADVIDLDLRVRYSAAKARLDVRLVLAIAVALSRAWTTPKRGRVEGEKDGRGPPIQ